jgi:hypothetical protein
MNVKFTIKFKTQDRQKEHKTLNIVYILKAYLHAQSMSVVNAFFNIFKISVTITPFFTLF